MISWDDTRREYNYGQEIIETKSRFKAIVQCSECGRRSSTTIRSRRDLHIKNDHYICHKCRCSDRETKEKLSEASKKMWSDNRDRLLAARNVAKISESIKEKWRDEKYREGVIKSNHESHDTILYKRKMSKIISKKWEDPEYADSIRSAWDKDKRAEMAESKSRYFEELRPQMENDFIEAARIIHGDKYNYSSVQYVDAKTKVIISCPAHGEFEQSPTNHLSGNGCPKCGREESRKKHRLSTEEFVNKAQSRHGDKYRYDDVEYGGTREEVAIVCSKHGTFRQRPNDHLSGRGCASCAIENSRLTNDEFIEKAKSVHGDKYDYSKSEYVNQQTKVVVICDDHGEFLQTPNNHLHGRGCPRCAGTQMQNDINDYINSLGLETIFNDRSEISPHELDIYVPEKRIAVELHGLYWHSYDRIEAPEEKMRHSGKCDKCGDIRLIQIFENEWVEKTEIVKSVLESKLGMSKRIYARKCQIVEISKRRHIEFMDENHMQGGKGCTVAYGLEHDDRLLAVMSFNKHHKYQWEITRFATEVGMTVVGGASKIFKHFIREHNPDSILTFADRRYSDGNLYKKLGFDLDSITSPNYFYVKNHRIFSRQQFQKHKLKDKLENFDPEMTEVQNMFNNGYRRLWDAGHHKLIWRKAGFKLTGQ